jgi:glycosyltransferase involved in cell wall biosynthesis
MINHSFAVMAYEDSPFLSECLDSLKNQTVESKIYITTSTPSAYISELAKKFTVEVYVAEPGQGIAHDWYFSLQQAKTKYVTLAHQDDLYMPEYAASSFSAAEKFTDTLISFTGYTEIVDGRDRSNTLLLRVKRFILWFFMPFRKNIHSRFRKKLLLSAGCPIAAPSVMYNIEKLIGFQFSDEFSINMDWDAWYRMSKMEGRFVYVKKTLLKHRIHADSATTAGLEANLRQSEDLIMFKRFWPVFFSKLLAKFYARSYKSNKNKTT